MKNFSSHEAHRANPQPSSPAGNLTPCSGFPVRPPHQGYLIMLKFIGGTVGVIFLIGLLVVIGLFSLIF